MATADNITPHDPYCDRDAKDIPSVVYFAEGDGMTPEQWVKTEEGTYNYRNGHFACDECYIALGMPTSREGWVAP